MHQTARSELELDALEARALAWVGTPWCDGSASIGRGVCCHRLLASVYHEAGWLPEMELPDAPAAHARGNDRPIMLEWFRGPGAAYFDEVIEVVLPGLALLVRVGHVPHHLCLALRGNRILHVSHRQGVQIVENANRWLRHLAHAFEPRRIER